jgi:hypothetical protein
MLCNTRLCLLFICQVRTYTVVQRHTVQGVTKWVWSGALTQLFCFLLIQTVCAKPTTSTPRGMDGVTAGVDTTNPVVYNEQLWMTVCCHTGVGGLQLKGCPVEGSEHNPNAL